VSGWALDARKIAVNVARRYRPCGDAPSASPLPPANHQIYLFASLSEVFERDNLAPDNPIQP